MEKQALIPFTKEEYSEIARIASEYNKGKLVVVNDSYLGTILGSRENKLIVGMPKKFSMTEKDVTVSEYLEKDVDFCDARLFDREFDVDYFSEELENEEDWRASLGMRHIVDVMDSDNSFKYIKMLYEFINPCMLQYPFDSGYLDISTSIDLVSERNVNYFAIVFEFEDFDFNWRKKDCLKEINKFFQLYGINLKN